MQDVGRYAGSLLGRESLIDVGWLLARLPPLRLSVHLAPVQGEALVTAEHGLPPVRARDPDTGVAPALALTPSASGQRFVFTKSNFLYKDSHLLGTCLSKLACFKIFSMMADLLIDKSLTPSSLSCS